MDIHIHTHLDEENFLFALYLKITKIYLKKFCIVTIPKPLQQAVLRVIVIQTENYFLPLLKSI